MDSEKDHVWRFAIEPKSDPVQGEDVLVEMVRVFLADFLNLGCLTANGKQVTVDGFAFANDRKKIYHIFPDSAASGGGVAGEEPSAAAESARRCTENGKPQAGQQVKGFEYG